MSIDQCNPLLCTFKTDLSTVQHDPSCPAFHACEYCDPKCVTCRVFGCGGCPAGPHRKDDK